jgi:hypothetical protein
MVALGRLLCSIGVAAVLLIQPALALAAPTPSPALDGILLKPPGTGFKEEPKTTPGALEGPFDATRYAAVTGAVNAAATTQALARDGFISGFGRTWVSAGSKNVWVEAVMAFTGGTGAKTWLGQSKAADKADVNYSQALTITGIDSYYGARLVDKVHKIYGDAFVFVKGNNVYLVTYVSSNSNLATIAATQTKKQYDAAPPYTIPPAQWPQPKAASSIFDGLKTIATIVGVLLILGLIGAGGFLFWSRRRSTLRAIPLQDPPGFVSMTSVPVPATAAVPAPVAVPAAADALAPEGPFVMSEDRLSWWDGTAWRDAAHEVPPAAQRSEDGQFWWDGEAWRSMPPSPFGG